MASELRHAVRSLRRAPGFLAASVLLLALAIAPTVGVFGLTDVVLLRQLSTPRPEQLVVFEKVAMDGDTDTSFSYPVYRDLRDRAAGLSQVVAYDASVVALQSGDTTERVLRELVSGNYFQCLQTKPFLGRLLLPEDDQQPGARPVAVLTYGYWRERFGGDTKILGQTVRLNGYPFTVIGVAEPRFRGLRAAFRPAVVVPMMMQGQLDPAWPALERRGTSWLKIIGRLESGAATTVAEAQVSAKYQSLLREDLAGASLPDTVRQELLAERVRLAPGDRGFSPLASRYGRPLTVVLAMTAILWLVAALNFLSLFAARFTAQRRELAVRSALGATSFRLMLGVIAEVAIVAVLGGCTGFALASPFAMVLLGFVPSQSSPLETGALINLRLVGLALGLTVTTIAVVGTYILLRLRADSDLDFRPHGFRQTVRDWLSVSALSGRLVLGIQFAGAAILLIAAGLVVRSVVNLRHQPLGYNASNVTLISIAPSLQGYTPSRAADLFERLRERVGASAGVASATFAFVDVVSGQGRRETIDVAAGNRWPARTQDVEVNLVGPRYFETLGIAVKAGRAIEARDRAGAGQVVVVSETFAHTFFDGTAVGRRFRWAGSSVKDPGVEIIGIVSDIKYRSVRAPSPALVYIPVTQDPVADATLYVRSTLPASAMLTTVRQEITRLDPGVAPFNVRTLDRQIDESLATERGLSFLATALGLLALVLTSAGLTASLAQMISRRTREIGIRLALGASPDLVRRRVALEGLLPAIVGGALGMLVAYPATHSLVGVLFGVSLRDPLVLAASMATLMLVAGCACYVPALRASKVDPVIALRAE
jgi:predicted permease